MAPLFPWPGRLLKETPIREASISGVRPRGHTQVRLLFMSAKPMKTLQPTSLTPTRLALWQTEEEFLLELKSQSATHLTTALICSSVLKWCVVSLSERHLSTCSAPPPADSSPMPWEPLQVASHSSTHRQLLNYHLWAHPFHWAII